MKLETPFLLKQLRIYYLYWSSDGKKRLLNWIHLIVTELGPFYCHHFLDTISLIFS